MFSAAKLNYDMHNKELLAIYKVFCKWRHYLEGTSILVEVLMDHKNLTYFQESKLLSQMVTYLFVIEELGVVSTSRAYKAKIR